MIRRQPPHPDQHTLQELFSQTWQVSSLEGIVFKSSSSFYWFTAPQSAHPTCGPAATSVSLFKAFEKWLTHMRFVSDFSWLGQAKKNLQRKKLNEKSQVKKNPNLIPLRGTQNFDLLKIVFSADFYHLESNMPFSTIFCDNSPLTTSDVDHKIFLGGRGEGTTGKVFLGRKGGVRPRQHPPKYALM